MNGKQAVEQAVFGAVDEVNEMLPEGHRLQKSADTVLLGESGNLDSLGLVSFIVAVEERIEKEFNISVSFVDEMANPEGALRNIGTLVEYIIRKL